MKPWIIYFSIINHLVYGVCLLISPVAMNITPMIFFNRIGITHTYTSLMFFSVSIFALIGLFRKGLIYFFPQQMVLFATSFGALTCVINSSYADGVKRDWIFIFPDQFPSILICILYTASILNYVLETNHGS